MTNVIDTGGDEFRTPDCKFHAPTIAGEIEFGLPVLTENRKANNLHAGQSIETMQELV